MALDPVPAHLMRLERGVEALPQLGVLDRLLVGRAPAVFLPAVYPAGDALTHILAVGIKIDRARLFERLERRNRRHQLHPVVGGVRLAALQFLFGVAEFRMAPQPPGPGLPEHAPSVWIVTEGSLLTRSIPRLRRRSRGSRRRFAGSAACGHIPAGLSAAPARRKAH